MIRLVVAIDSTRGLADDHGIPWQGKIPIDVSHFHQLVRDHSVLMGRKTYDEFARPMDAAHNFVLTHASALRPGFEPVHDLAQFLQNAPEDLWIIGGADLFVQTLPYADELYITRVDGDFHCTKSFPAFEDAFSPVEEGEPHEQNGITFNFCIYRRNI